MPKTNERDHVTSSTGRVLPTGTCWCGCGAQTKIGAFFVPGHDKRAEGFVVKSKYGSIAHFLLAHGFGGQDPRPCK